MKIYKLILLLSIITTAAIAQQNTKPIPVEPGVSKQLAEYRRSVIGRIHYHIVFNIPPKKNEPVTGVSGIRFDLNSTAQDIQIDFKAEAKDIKLIEAVGFEKLSIVYQNEHIIIDKKYLKLGENFILITFTAGNASLNRNDDYLYSLSVPDRARTIFPCFDQPDLKAEYMLLLNVPKGWQVLANGAKQTTPQPEEKDGHVEYFFNQTDQLPTYLFSFTAGKYTSVTKTISNLPAEFLYRETDSTKIKLSVDSVFKLHADAIDFLQQWTDLQFPFQKVGFVAIPDFQFGGMEHPGEVQYKASSLFLDAGATKDQLIGRANLISHETAHMWFGDLVTMKWFNDVWMKEVFANFMADKVTEKVMGNETFNLKFLIDHYPAAYGVDRTLGANPIRQQLDNLQDAGSMYGNIIYHKAPIMMRQLETLMGKDNFQDGIREYLRKYAYKNATWDDLIAILSSHTKSDLYSWNKVWVNQPGRPVFNYAMAYAAGKIKSLNITQHPESGAKRFWPQVFNVTLVYPGKSKTIAVNMNKESVALTAAAGLPKPSYILFNSEGMGYGLFPADKVDITAIKSPLQRASAYVNAYENMLAGRYFKPEELLNSFVKYISTEQNELNLRLISGYITNIYWEFLPAKTRQAHTLNLEDLLWNAMQQQAATNNKKILFNAYQNVYGSPQARARIYAIWQQQKPPEGIKLFEDDYTSLALSIALKSDTTTSVLKIQQDRVSNAERKNRLAFLMPALSLNVTERDNFFAGLADRKNRAKEAWVTTALSYLNHPLRQSTSLKYLPKSLELTEEIQRTGDVFFPQSWLAVVFGSYQSPQAYQVVLKFLKDHPNYNPKLKDKILQATDNLYRAQKLVK